MILLLHKLCIYNNITNETSIYGQYTRLFNDIYIENTEYTIVFCADRPDFFIKIKDKVSVLSLVKFLFDDNYNITYTDLKLNYPFEICDLVLDKDRSAIISTMCMNYSHRLDEWIQYNLKLGFSGILIFNNDENKLNTLEESTENCVIDNSMKTICNKYKGKVFMVDCPYSHLPGGHWTNIQRLTLHIGVNAFKNKCRNIALIDADEFIYIPKNPKMNIQLFLENYTTNITMKSNILTNKSDNDIINNNILKIACYIGENKYTKIILLTSNIKEYEFITSPHDHQTQIILDKSDIIHYHVWINKRYTYNESMEKINLNIE